MDNKYIQEVVVAVKEHFENDLPLDAWNVVRTAFEELREKHDLECSLCLYSYCISEYYFDRDLLTEQLESYLPNLEMVEEEGDEPLKAILFLLTGKYYERLYENNHAQECYDKALLHPEELTVTIDKYSWLINKGLENEFFSNSLLGFICLETERYQLLYDFYHQAGNREAECLALTYLAKDSIDMRSGLLEIINKYEDVSPVLEAVFQFCAHCNFDETLDDDKSDIEKMNKEAIKKHDLIMKFLKRFPNSPFAYQLQYQILRMEEAYLRTPDIPKSITCGTPLNIPLTVRNIKQLVLNIYRTDLKGDDAGYNPSCHDDYEELLPHIDKEPFFSKTFVIPSEKPFLFYSVPLQADALPYGIYLVELITENGGQSKCMLHVSNLKVIALPLPKRNVRLVVLNISTGKPVPFANILVDEKKTLTCDEEGECLYKMGKKEGSYLSLFPFIDDDCASPAADIYIDRYTFRADSRFRSFKLLTDRSIYRPGQTIHIACICYEHDAQYRLHTIKTESKLTLKKAYEDKAILNVSIATDEFGVGSYDFKIPEDIKTGEYCIRCNDNWDSSIDIRIEEYKRPTFEVTFDEVKESFKVGDTVKVTGKAMGYSGIAVSNSTVNYSIKRNASWWWMMCSFYWNDRHLYNLERETTLFDGNTRTDESGEFQIDVPMLLPNNPNNMALFMDIIVEVDVTDINGETQSCRYCIPLSNREFLLYPDTEEKNEKHQGINFTPVLKNAVGTEIKDDVEYWIDDNLKQSVKSNTKVTLAGLSSGKHIIHLRYGGIEDKTEFVVFDIDGIETPYETNEWSYQSCRYFKDEGEVTIQVGCSKANTPIYYSLFAEHNMLESSVLLAPTGMINIKYKYQKEYKNAIHAAFAWVIDGQMYSEEFNIEREIPHHDLQLNWSTFRDKVQPGSAEEWQLQVKQDARNIVPSNVIATLYDKSLDQLWKGFRNDWNNMGPHLSWNTPNTCWDDDRIGTTELYYREKNSSLKENSVPEIIYTGSLKYSYHRSRHLGLHLHEDDECVMACDMALPSPAGGSYACRMESPQKDFLTLRKDFSETAFFFPRLRTGVNGLVTLSFNLPDSITTWKFKAMAHTREMTCGFMEDEIIARKELMVQPNIPRFFRVGDDSSLTAKIINSSDKASEGMVTFMVLDAKDEHVCFEKQDAYSLKAGESTAVTINFIPDDEITDYIVRIYVSDGRCSDGEQHLVPVLSDKAEVVRTTPFTMDGACNLTIKTDEMIPSGVSRRKLLLEYTNNPIWLAIDYLPKAVNYSGMNSISLVHTIYINTLSRYLKAKANEEDDKTTNIWIKNGSKVITQLKRLQHTNGAFSWFAGMPESEYITSEIVMHLARIVSMTGQKGEVLSILEYAFDYLDDYVDKEVKRLRNIDKQGIEVCFPTFMMLQYLYSSSLIKRAASKRVKENFDYLIKLLLGDIHEQTMYEKSMTSVVLDAYGYHQKAQLYAESLRQYTRLNAVRGRTFCTSRATYSWMSYKIPTHVMGMEALYRLCPTDKQTIKEMQLWLLQEKRTQNWDTPIDCLNAVYALLLDAVDYLHDGRMPEVLIDQYPLLLDANGREQYVRKNIPSTVNEVTLNKSSNGLSWGAIYASFLQPIKDVKSSGNDIAIDRQILNPKEKYHVGDRIRIRLTVQCKRNFDMVEIIDTHAACMESVEQLSWNDSFVHVSPLDRETRYYYHGLSEGAHSIETEYFITRSGVYELGLSTVKCLYAPEYQATCKSEQIVVMA